MTPEALFHLADGSPVYRGDILHVAPYLCHRAGATCEAEFSANGSDEVTVRSIPSGAVPTVPISGLSRTPHPDTTDRALMAKLLRMTVRSITERDLEMFRAGRLHAEQRAQEAAGRPL